MIVRRFLQWVRTAPALDRADATAALARAYLYADMSVDDRAAAEGALAMLLDDPAPVVREALAETLAASADAPRFVISGLLADLPAIAARVAALSPLLTEAELVDLAATGEPAVQSAIAGRERVSRAVAAALAEVADAEACLVLLENPGAELTEKALSRIVSRHGALAALREALLQREDLPTHLREELVAALSRTLAAFVVSKAWMPQPRAETVAREASDKAVITLAAAAGRAEVRPLVMKLAAENRLTPLLMLRALLSGEMRFVEEAFAELSGLPLNRVSALVHDRKGSALRALCERAGLPATLYPAFHCALMAHHEIGYVADPMGETGLRRRVIERLVTLYGDRGEADAILPLLRRFEAEAARDEARAWCADYAADEPETLIPDEEPEVTALVEPPRRAAEPVLLMLPVAA